MKKGKESADGGGELAFLADHSELCAKPRLERID
jgi:hypothetical protein